MYNGVHRGPIYVTAIMCLMAGLTLHCASTSCSMRSRPAGNPDQCGYSCGTCDMILQRQAEAELDEDGS
jgi:hypothetical protein